MTKRKIFILVVIALSIAGIYRFSSGNPQEASDAGRLETEKQDTPSKEYLTNYIIDKNHRIHLADTSLSDKRSTPGDAQLKDNIADKLVDRRTTEYFRFLQTHFNEGRSFQENTEAIHQHLISILPKDKGEELFDLYNKFVRFEYDAAQKAKEWKMPNNAGETLELIAKMQKYQQEYFGEETADLLFGADLKVLEYDARYSGVINDEKTSGTEKEILLRQLDRDMWGDEAEKIRENKSADDRYDEIIRIYKNDLDAMDPAKREAKIREFREKYLPAPR